MATYEEWKELMSSCTWTYTTENEVIGFKVTGTKTGYTDKSIFLPRAGRQDETSHTNGYHLDFSTYYDSGRKAWVPYYNMASTVRDIGYSVRSVVKIVR